MVIDTKQYPYKVRLPEIVRHDPEFENFLFSFKGKWVRDLDEYWRILTEHDLFYFELEEDALMMTMRWL